MKTLRSIFIYLACLAGMLSTALAQGQLAFVTSTLPVIFAGSNTTITNDVSGGNATFTWSITKGVLPAALTLCGTTGIISGVPSAPGSASIEMKVEDSSTPPQVALRPLKLVIQPDAPLLTQPPSLSAKVGVLFSYTFSATGGKTPYAWAVANSTPSLPSGITLNPVTGILSGTVNKSSSPNVDAIYDVSVKVTGNNSQVQVKSFTLTVNPSDAPTITTIQLSPDAELGIAYPGGSISASGGAGNYTFQNLSPMPSGLSLSSTGTVSGTANGTVAQNPAVRIKVTDSVGRSSEKFVNIRILSASVPSITTASTGPQGSINVPYTFVLTATGGKAPYTWDVPSGNGASGAFNLPPGMILSANGTLTGPPTKGGDFQFYPRVTDANGNKAMKLLTIVIKDPTFAITGTDISSDICGILKQPYSTVNGKSPYAWTLTGAPSSSGVTMNATTGSITGNLTSVAPGNYTLTLRVTDSVGQNATASKVLTVRPATPLSWANTSPPTLGAASQGAPYTAKVLINGGRSPYKYVLKSGSTLPSLLTLNASTGEIKGTPTSPGNYTFTITGSDSCTGTTIDRTFSLVVNSLAVVCKPIIQNKCSMVVYTGATVIGGVSPYSWTTTTALPASLVMDPSTGKIQGKLTAAVGNLTVMVKATDKNGSIATGPLNITINPVPPLAWLSPVSPLNLSDAYKSSVYNAVLTLSGGVTPYKFALKAGSALPLGLTLNSTTGKISGTPTSTGNTTFTIVATESSCDGLSTKGVFNLNVLDPLALTGSTITGNKCSSIAPTLMTLTGGAAPFKWTVSPALPSALSINQTTGVVSGSLTSKAGNYSVGVTVTDKNGKTVTAPLGIKILALPTFAWVTTANLTDGYKSYAYPSTQLSVTGGIAPYTLSLKSGNLTTAGLSFNATTGVISGTPTKAGNYTFTITAKESSCDKLAIDRVFSLKVFDPVIIGGPSISGNKCSSVIGANYTVSGGAPPFTWSTVPMLPASMSINVTTGRISGNLTTGAGIYSIQATDRNGRIATKSIAITINALPAFTWLSMTANLTVGYAGSVYNNGQLSVTGGIAPYTFSLKSGNLTTSGLTLNSTTGVISGTPTTAGNYTFSVIAKESSCDALTIEKFFNLKLLSPLTCNQTLNLPCLYVEPFTLQIVADNDFAVFAGNSSGITRLIYQNDSEWPQQIVKAQSLTFDLQNGEDTYFILAMDGSLTADISGKINGNNIVDLIEGGSEKIKVSKNISQYLNVYNLSTVEKGTYVANLGSAQNALSKISDAEWIKPTANFTNEVIKNNPYAYSKALGKNAGFAYPVNGAVFFRVSAGDVGIIPETIAFTATGGKLPYTWTILPVSNSTTALPKGMLYKPSVTGNELILYGSVKESGVFPFIARVTDALGNTCTQTQSITVYQKLEITNSCPLASGTNGTAYTANLTASGGKPSYKWALVPANTGLPPGLSLNATTGVISGTPTAIGNFTFSYKVTDGCSQNATKNCTMTILDPCNLVSPLSFATLSPLSSWVVGQYNEYQFAVTGGLSPYVFEIDQSTLPPGVSANSQGKIFGTPTQVASSSGTPEVYWVQWNSPSSYPFTTPYNHARATTGKINIPGGVQIEVTLSGEILKNASAFGVNDGGLFWGPPNVYKSSIVPSLPTNSDHISIDGRAFPAQKINFTSAGLAKEVSNIVMFIWSLGSPGDSAKYMFENDFDVLTANQFFIKNGRQLEGSEGHGSIVFPGKFTSIAWNMPDPEHYNSWNIGITSAYTNKIKVKVIDACGSEITGLFDLGVNSSSSISPAQPMPTMAMPILNGWPQTSIVNAKSLLPNVLDKDLAKADHLVTLPFLIGKSEVTNEDYCVFLNAVAKQSDSRGIYNVAMGSTLNGGILRTGKAGAYKYTAKTGMGNYPVVYVSWFDAARYVNWLSNGSQVGVQDKTTTEDGAYALNGAVAGVGIARNATNANTKQKPKYWLLNESEWYTSAYLKPANLTSVAFWNYPTQSDAAPDLTLNNERNLANYGNVFDGPTESEFFCESPGPFGTLDQGGNVREWTESVDSGKYRIIRGGSWADAVDAMKASESDVADPAFEDDKTGFRVGGAP